MLHIQITATPDGNPEHGTALCALTIQPANCHQRPKDDTDQLFSWDFESQSVFLAEDEPGGMLQLAQGDHMHPLDMLYSILRCFDPDHADDEEPPRLEIGDLTFPDNWGLDNNLNYHE